MATLNEVMKETADAIREKTGKSELIKPIDFATEIKGITSGGSGGENGGGNYIYYKHRETTSGLASDLWKWSQLVKMSFGGQTIICPPYYASLQFRDAPEDIKLEDYIEEVCIDFGLKLELPGEGVFTIEELIGTDKNLLEYITKEQFYDLNA